METCHTPARLFALGSNGSGQLGIGHEDDVSTPQECLFEIRAFQQPHECDPKDSVVKVVAGGNHTLVLFASGTVYAAGNNAFGQCGLPSDIPRISRYRRVRLHGSETSSSGQEVDVFDDISATWEASFFVRDDIIHVRGQGMKGELGLGQGTDRAEEKGSVIDLSKVLGRRSRIKEIKSCMSHTIVLTEDGQLLGWGAARKGQLGDESKQEKIVWKPRKIDMPLEVAKIAVGRDFTFAAGVKDRWHWLLGDNKYENEHLPDLKTFDIAGGEGTYDLTASWSNIYALSHSDQQLQGWGRNDRGQLPSQHLPKLEIVAAGSEHCVALTAQGGEVLAWGWGEHGNCGEATDAQANAAGGRWNVLPVPLLGAEHVTGVGAGCATSFIFVKNMAHVDGPQSDE